MNFNIRVSGILRFKPICFLLLVLILFSCGNNKQRFQLMPSGHTGIDFKNTLIETPRMNIFTYLYFYNGGGVAAGDLNGDGLPDLYFTSNLDSNKLYINEGNFKFREVTEVSHVSGQRGWTAGVTMADINGDGRLDIYVSQLGDYKNIRGKNQLYINQGNDENGIPLFEDQAKSFGLDLVGFSTQAAFFDYDLDGDLDMYMLNHSVHGNGTFIKASLRREKHPLSGDKLMRNDGAKFTDVTDEAGIYNSVLGYGLGINIADVNWDGYPDIYVGNDFHENDYLYINNGDGTFKECLYGCMPHTSRFSMGNDIADINNDGLPDIFSLDMLPADPERLKASAGEDLYDVYNYKLNFGYGHQLARNTLQLNLGEGKFSDIAMMSGVYATDWSWSALLADLDLDGYRDIFIANGVKRRSNDMDYINFVSKDVVQHRLEGDLTEEDLKIIEKMPVVKIPNYTFKNNGDLTFEDVSSKWGLGQPSLSNGAVYADLDNDGDLDLVTNNIDAEAFVYQNNTIKGEEKENHYIKVKFSGKGKNPFGIGTKVILHNESEVLISESFTTRGYQSAVPNELILGLGKSEKVDSLVVIWPDQSFQVLKNIQANQTLVLDQTKASGTYVFKKYQKGFFTDVTGQYPISYIHKENNFIEFNREALIPHMVSTEGPKLAIADVNGDGREDFYVGGAKHQPGELYLQTTSGYELSRQQAFAYDSLSEDTDAVFYDIDGDGDKDLIVVSGGNEFRLADEPMLVRLYQNDGLGNFSRNRNSIPDIYANASCVKGSDYDKDGDTDLFIGGRSVPWKYGEIPKSYLLQNDGKGNFQDVTLEAGGENLSKSGMVKDAVWADLDKDGDDDLIIVGEWMPISIYFNEGNRLTLAERGELNLENTEGWWNTVLVEDIDQDGDMDIIAGNLGLNSKLKADKDQPVEMYVNDFDQNGSYDQLLFYYLQGERTLFASRDELTQQLAGLKDKFMGYKEFAQAGFSEILPENDMKNAIVHKAFEMRSGVFLNDGQMKFTFKAFPFYAQVSPIKALLKFDYNQDGRQDLLAAGNFYESNMQQGRYDASYGILLENQRDGSFLDIPNRESGIFLEGQVRDIAFVHRQDSAIIMIAKNKAPLQFITQKKTTN